MCVVPNGVKGGHVAVNLRLMQGNFDNALEWPYTGSITVQLLNWIRTGIMWWDHFLLLIRHLDILRPLSKP